MSDGLDKPPTPKTGVRNAGWIRVMVPLLLIASFFLGRHSSRWWPLSRPTENPFHLPADLLPFFDLLSTNRRVHSAAFKKLERTWQDSYVIMLLEVLHFSADPEILRKTVELIQSSVDDELGPFNIIKWMQWVWNRDPEMHPHYAKFKSALYAREDSRFEEYFDDSPATAIRLDEILWGGVRRDGIPPLDHPELIVAAKATYLRDDHVVFGVEINGDARAYPKRILAHHEMVKDWVGDQEINGVYCTLCGSMIVYQTTVKGVHYELGTSGFLYRSNKLMYDHQTRSLWNTLTGKPVVGPLVGNGIQLQPLYTVTSTWGEWRQRHPDTRVLSLNTGHQRDYGEGVAYQEYFATDKLMFPVPKLDNRLMNKSEVLVLRFGGDGAAPQAISTDFLSLNPLYTDELGGVRFVVLTDKSDASRVYETQDKSFVSWDQKDKVVDDAGNVWQLDEDGLRVEGSPQLTLQLQTAIAREAF